MRRHLEKLKEHSKSASIKLKEHSNNLFNSLKSKHVATLVEPITNYKQIFLYSFIALLLVHIYAVFFKSPYFLPGLEERTFLFLVPLFVLTVLFYTPWGKIVSKISGLKLISRISGLHLLKKLKLKERAHSFEYFLQNLSIQTIKEFLHKEKIKNFTKYAFLFFLLLVTISSLKFEQTMFISKPLVEIQFPLTIVTIILGALTFWQNKEVIQEIEEEQNNEEKEEQKRALEFGEKYPKLATIPLVNKVTKWMYKEGWDYSFGLILIVIVALFFLLPNLGNFLTVDEPRWINTNNFDVFFPDSYEEATNSQFIGKSYARSEAYWESYLSGDLAKTFNNANPSATLNFLHLPSFIFKDLLNFEQYLFLSRLVIIIHNIILMFFLYFLLKKITSKRNSFLFFTSIMLLPQVIGYSRIINHDSFQGLYVLAFILSLWIGLQNNNKKYYYISGIFYALALLTQYKSAFIMVLLFLLPILFSYFKNNFNNLKCFVSNLKFFYICAIATAIIILPAVLVYPQLLIKRLIYYDSGLLGISYLLIVFIFTLFLLFDKKLSLIKYIKKFEKYIIYLFVGSTSLLFFYLIFNRFEILNILFNNFGRFTSFYDAILGSYLTFFFSIPLVLLILFFIKIIFIIKENKIDFSFFLVFIFFILVFFATLQSFIPDVGYILLDTRYLGVFLPIFLAGIFITKINLSKKVFLGIILILILTLAHSNFIFSPFYTFHNNIFLPEGYLISRTTWATDTGLTAEYINNNLNNITIYNPRGRIENFLNEDINVIPWYVNFWEHSPDYIIVEWEKSHKFTNILDYYRENEEPLWVIERNNTILTGIYLFNSDLNYESILNDYTNN
ncbi:MAG: glycosyltransferase family 39 protein [Candidatus Nanoarchaeia archaeon]|nr:glycosyltransferase family 39 protein [Candidatus Nanoarchaeia archaeon]